MRARSSEMLDARHLRRVTHLTLIVVAWSAIPLARADESAAPQQRQGRGGPGSGLVYKARITPHWFAEGARFWYRNDLKGGTREFVMVDAEKGTKTPAFDHTKLAAAL